MKIGIVGLPNAGKSTLFNALCEAEAETAGYAFTTVDPNQAIVKVPDKRLDDFARSIGASETVHDTIAFVDIAGLVPGAHRGEGLGNRFLSNIRETDAIVHVVRSFRDDQVTHTEGRINPIADIEIIETELILADLDQAERRLEKVVKQAKSGERKSVAERDWLKRLIESLKEGRFASECEPPDDAADAQGRLFSLTAKPFLYLANITDDDAGKSVEQIDPLIAEHAKRRGAEAIAICVKLESELVGLGCEEAEQMRSEMGIASSGLDLVVNGAYDLLGLITFFTGEKDMPAQSWAIPRGSTAEDAAAKIHSDIASGFIKADVIPVEELTAHGSWAGARDAGDIRAEGRGYTVQDGDAFIIKHT